MAKQEITCDDILRELKAGQYRPIYYLMGEEPYYIDLISDYITDNVLNENEKEFNLTVVYGADVDVAAIINAAKRYPMMSEHQVVVAVSYTHLWPSLYLPHSMKAGQVRWQQ